VCITASVHSRLDLCIPNWWQVVPDTGISTWWRTVHAAGERRHLHGGHSMVGVHFDLVIQGFLQ